MKFKIILTAILLAFGFTIEAQTIALTFENAEITNDGTNDYYEVDVFIVRTSMSDFKLGDGQFYVDYNPSAFGSGIDNTEVDFEYPPGSILAEENVLAIYGTPVINANTATTVSIAWQQVLSAGSMATENVTDTPTLLGHIKIIMINTAESPDICFNVSGSLFDDQFYTACGPFEPGLATRDCFGENAGTQIFDYDGSDCSGAILPVSCVVKTWNGSSWNPSGAPTDSDNVVISGDYNTASNGGSITACEVTVDAGMTLTIAADEFLSVVNDITVNGILNVSQTANLVQIEDDAIVTNNGEINVYVDTPDLDGRDFILLGSPMSSETRTDVFEQALRVRNHLTEEFSPNTEVTNSSPGAGNWVDEEGNDWPVLENGAINPGEGYMVMRDLTGPPAPLNLNFNSGTLNNGIVTYLAAYNGNQNSSPSVLSNPYASAISATDFITTNAGVVDAVYFWEHVTSPNGGVPGPYGLNYTMEDISIFNLTGGTAAAGSDPSTTPTGMISTGKGFGIKVISSGGSVPITFNNAMRRTTGNAMPRSQNDDRIWLNIQSEDYELKSTALIGFLAQATDGFDVGYDAKRLATNVSLYSHLDDGSDILGIQARGVFDENVKIPMGFATLIDERTNYTITIQDIEGLHLETATVYLIDTVEDVITTLSETNYTFTSEKGIYDNRFILQFVPELILGTTNNLLETVTVYPNPTHHTLTVVSSKAPVLNITVYDVMGRIVMNNSDLNSTHTQLNLSELSSAMYLIEINTEEGKVTKSIIKE